MINDVITASLIQVPVLHIHKGEQSGFTFTRERSPPDMRQKLSHILGCRDVNSGVDDAAGVPFIFCCMYCTIPHLQVKNYDNSVWRCSAQRISKMLLTHKSPLW